MPMVTIRASVTPRSMRGAAGGVTPALYHEMTLLRNALVQNLREEAPVNKNPNAKNRGALRASIRAGDWQTDGKRWRATFSANDYIKFVIRDTAPHKIEAKPGSVLAFTWTGEAGISASLPAISHASLGRVAGTLGRRGGPSIMTAPAGHAELKGGMVFLRFVNHPGTKANDFVQRAYDRTMREGTPGFTKRIQEAIANDIVQLLPGGF